MDNHATSTSLSLLRFRRKCHFFHSDSHFTWKITVERGGKMAITTLARVCEVDTTYAYTQAPALCNLGSTMPPRGMNAWHS
jgi:hypothetical protein